MGLRQPGPQRLELRLELRADRRRLELQLTPLVRQQLREPPLRLVSLLPHLLLHLLLGSLRQFLSFESLIRSDLHRRRRVLFESDLPKRLLELPQVLERCRARVLERLLELLLLLHALDLNLVQLALDRLAIAPLDLEALLVRHLELHHVVQLPFMLPVHKRVHQLWLRQPERSIRQQPLLPRPQQVGVRPSRPAASHVLPA